MNHPLVSVVINFLDAENFLEEAIASVFAQSYQNWELLLVDDGSADGSTAIARECAARHPGRVRYLEHAGHANKGGAASRNVGFREAKGDWVAFLDADDVWLSAKLERQIEVLEHVPRPAMVIGLAHVWHRWGSQTSAKKDYVKTYEFAENRLVEPPVILESFLRSPGKTPFPSAILIRREVAEEVGGFEERVRGTHDDQAFFAKVCLQYPVFVMDEVVFKYRIHENSLCQQELKSGHREMTRLKFLEWLEEYLQNRIEAKSSVRRELRRQLLPYKRPTLHRVLVFRSAAKRTLLRLGRTTARQVSRGAYERLRRRLRQSAT